MTYMFWGEQHQSGSRCHAFDFNLRVVFVPCHHHAVHVWDRSSCKDKHFTSLNRSVINPIKHTTSYMMHKFLRPLSTWSKLLHTIYYMSSCLYKWPYKYHRLHQIAYFCPIWASEKNIGVFSSTRASILLYHTIGATKAWCIIFEHICIFFSIYGFIKKKKSLLFHMSGFQC